MHALSKLFEALHLTRKGRLSGGHYRRRRQTSRRSSFLSCETLESKQLLAADVAQSFATVELDTTGPVTVAIEGKFQEDTVSGTVVKFDTNAPVSDSDIYIELAANTTLTNANFLSYVNNSAYDNTMFHRSVNNFVLQGGGFTAPTVDANQQGSDPVSIPTTGTVNNEPGNLNIRGTIAMAKLGERPDSATSQFFFNLNNNPFLDSNNGGYTVFGEVLGSGMSVVDTMALQQTYDATTYYANTALAELPLYNTFSDNIIRPNDFLKIENADVVTESDLMTYVVESSDTAKLTASFDGNGDLVLTPVGSATGSVDVTVTATSKLDSESDSQTFSVQLPAPVLPITPIESLGSTVLGKDATGKLYAGVQAISFEGQHLTETRFPAFTPLAVEDFGSNGGKEMLLEKSDGSYTLWSMTSSWAYQSHIIIGAGDTSAINAALVKFGLADPAPELTPIEAQGDVTLAQDANGNLYANDIAITRRGKAVTFGGIGAGLTPVAVEQNIPKGDSTVNAMLLEAGDGSIWRWELTAGWEYVRYFGANDQPESTGFYNAETQFGVDVNDDTRVGAPALTPIEAQGDVTLAQDANGNLYANDIAITRRGKAVTFGGIGAGLTPVAVEQNIPKGDSTVNAMLLEAGDGSIWRWELTAGWEYVRYFGANDQPESTGFYNAETQFGVDVNDDTRVGAPALTPIEAQGDVTLAQDANGNLYANDIAITRRGKAVTFGGIGAGLTPVAVEQNIPKGDSTVNAMLLEAGDGSIWRWELTAGWEYVRYFGANDQPGTSGFNNAELNFESDVDGDGQAGVENLIPIETNGTNLSKDAAGNLYAGFTAISRRGSAVSLNNPTSTFELIPLAVESNTPKGDSTVNSLLLKADDGSIWRWEMNANWEYVRFFGANDTSGTAGFNNAELHYQIDINQDGKTGVPELTPIEAQGDVTLAQDANGNLYANDIAITRRGKAVTFGGIGAGLTPVAVEQNIPKGDSTVNAMLLEAGDGSIWRWELTAGWEYVRYFGANDQPESTGFYNAETQFGVDVNDDTRVGAPALTPIEAQGDVTLAQDANGNLYANDIAITRRGKAVTFGGIGAGLTPVAVEQNIPKGDSTVNAMLLEAGDGSIWRWELTAGWEYVRYFGANDQPESTGFLAAEILFNIDVDGNSSIG